MDRRLLVVTAALALARAAVAAPSVAAVRTTGPVTIDGALTEPAWAAAPWTGGFVDASTSEANAGANRPAAVQTRYKVLYDDRALYVGVEADEPNPGAIRHQVTEHDGDAYGDDCVELFFDPAGEGRYYHHFVINTNGAWYDDYGADYGLVHGKLWDAPIETGAKVDPAGKVWRVEARIPFATLNLRADAGSTWKWNVARERYAGGHTELTTWSPLKGNFHAPRLWGTLTGVNVDWKTFALELGEPRASVAGGGSGAHTLNLRLPVTNRTGQPRKLRATARIFGRGGDVTATPDLDLAPGATGEAAFPPLTIPPGLLEAPIQLTVADAADGAPLKVVVRPLSAAYRPVGITVLDPVYRNNLYATQDLPAIRFQVTLADDVAAKAQTVAARLVDDAGKTVRQVEAPAARLAEPLSVDARGLALGKYELVVEARAGDQLAEARTVIRKLPKPAGNEVRIDERRNLLINGQPQVLIGWYGGVPTEDPRHDVVELQDVTTPVVLTGPNPEPVRKAWQEHGTYSIVSIEPGRVYYTFDLWRDPKNTIAQEPSQRSEPSPELLGYVKQIVDAVKNEPGLVGYYIADEPEINNTRSDYLEALFAAMQELDPYHPVVVTNDTQDGLVTHGYRCADILSPDPYSPEYDYVPNFLKKVLEVAPRGKGTMLTPWQSSGQTHFTDAYGTAPPYPYRVSRNQYLVGLALGARGFTGYTSAFFMGEPILRFGLPAIWREVRFLEPALAAPALPVTVEADEPMTSWLGRQGGQVYLIVVNHKRGARTAKISSPTLAEVRRLDVLSEGRQVELTAGGFTDRFAEGDVHVYTTDPAGRALPTTAAVEQLIADETRNEIKPGNLLHVSRGVRARASDGFYAPWFTQFFYYAINGLTDDLGWYLSHTDKPGWLELTLPKAESVGRVVVYSPNLQDYDLQFTGPDGTTRTAEVRGANAPISLHGFDPAIPTLKLRITALATRPGSQPARAQVSEIEAYSDRGTALAVPVKTVAAPVAPAFTAPAAETAGEPVLWQDTFTAFKPAEKYRWDGHDDQWVLNPQDLRAEPQPGGGLKLTSTAAAGYASMTRILPYDPAYRYLQVDLSKIEGTGYRWATLSVGDSSGKGDYRSGLNTMRPGIYTLDLHYFNDAIRTGKQKNLFLGLWAAGSAKQAAGPTFTYDWIRVVRRPQNGLAVTLADGSPLPPVLKAGDELLFRLFLDQPAQDATVEVLWGAPYSPLPLNGQASVQLLRADAEGRQWLQKVKLGPGTGKADALKGYPVVFRAVIAGGAIGETYASAGVKFE